MKNFLPDTTLAEALNINPFASRVFYKHGLRELIKLEISHQTLQQISRVYNINLAALLEDLNKLTFAG